jgi:hypothetical protein
MQFAAWCFSLLTRDTPVALMTDMTGTLISEVLLNGVVATVEPNLSGPAVQENQAN